MKTDIILIGLPGSGKGSIAKVLLSDKSEYVHLSTGDVFRKHIANQTELGIEITDIMNAGEFVNDELTIAVVEDFILTNQSMLIIFDGFPRTEKQLEWLIDFSTNDMQRECPKMLHICATENVCIARINNRAQLEKRSEDSSIEIIRKRLQDYRLLTEPVIASYSLIAEPIAINGDVSIVSCMAEVYDVLKE